jgi:NADH:ubiquinone oxidoreductase subunit 5 (subunit L)/multisubunit Na+/H+ antiporter MnhA subunit
VLLAALVLLPFLGGGLLALCGRRADRVAPAVGAVLAAATLAVAVAAAVARPAVDLPFLAGIRAGFAVDGLSALMVVTVAGATLAVLAFATGEAELRTGRFVGFVLVFAASMLATVTATTLAPLLFAWEAMGALSWALIGYRWREADRVRAAHTAFLTTRTADLGLYVAAGAAVAGGAGSLALVELPALAPPWLHLAAAGVVAAALGKSAQLPFSFWLSRAMEGPSPVSALLHSATMVAAGAYLLLRLVPLLAAAGWADDMVAWTGAATALLLGLVAVAQRDLKQLLAASTAAQIGFMVLAAGAGGTTAGALQLVAHAATKSLLFLAAGAWLVTLGTESPRQMRSPSRGAQAAPPGGRQPAEPAGRVEHSVVGSSEYARYEDDPPPCDASTWIPAPGTNPSFAGRSKQLGELRGAARRFPLVGATFTVGAASLAGLPPLSLWVSKDAVLAAALDRGPALYVLGLAAALVSAVYSAKAVWWVWQPAPAARPARVPAPMRPSLVALAIFAAGLGLLAVPLPLDPAPAGWELVVSAALAVGGVVAALCLGGDRLPEPRPLRSWLGLEAAARASVVRPVLATAAGLARVDGGLDRAVDGIARLVRRAAGALDRRGELSVDGVVRGVAAGSRALGRLARRPQTGQLHQYYAQSAAVLALLALLLILVR